MALYILAQVDAAFTLAVFLPLLAVIMLVNLLSQHIRRYRRASREAAGQVTNLLGELLGAVLAVKVAGAERRVIEHFEGLNERRRAADVRDAALTAGLESLAHNAANLGVGVLLLVAATQMRSGDFTVGDFALFTSYLGWLTTVTTMFGHYLRTYRQTQISLDRLVAMTGAEHARNLVAHRSLHLWGALPEITPPRRAAGDRLVRLSVDGLTCLHPETGAGIVDAGFIIERGQKVVIAGRVGAGKTTLLRALLGLLPADSGTIRWNDEVLLDPGTAMVTPRVSYTPQVPRLFSESLRDNLLMR